MNNDLLEESQELDLQFEKRDGLLPVVIQETTTGQILMMAWVNKEAFSYTLTHRKAAFWSTSRQMLWVKGETSGNTLHVDHILIDCDQDALVYQVTLDEGGVCHTFNRLGQNRKACFYRNLCLDTHRLYFLEE
ncbi:MULTISPECIES: phosphoribosyl-AMP cyclohydrolase [unclassified Siphonobacter]|uniref:phosphoribosyl-AMP cyclohydrolase n=1 Tax=unclassified Siphonobacter TaxID=2635712 RepID=UPI000CC11E40|nr:MULTISPECIES: phosphoribosyl-AMP cyclohydrolase [unclassified Siphonobacter]MDQ1090297.1 phosphoribosyl-AMP cyclohydrolase [Siphonobacter sp. SORGH_AS_1065]PKK35008.1 hypothetical protein BWI96_19455 [Siphonobacter sp. SORGH_AS_0500]